MRHHDLSLRLLNTFQYSFLKTSEIQWFSDVFRWYRNGAMTWNELIDNFEGLKIFFEILQSDCKTFLEPFFITLVYFMRFQEKMDYSSGLTPVRNTEIYFQKSLAQGRLSENSNNNLHDIEQIRHYMSKRITRLLHKIQLRSIWDSYHNSTIS